MSDPVRLFVFGLGYSAGAFARAFTAGGGVGRRHGALRRKHRRR